MFVALEAAITFLAKIGSNVPAGTVNETEAVSLQAIITTVPAPPIHKALTPTSSVASLGVTAVSLYAGNIAPGLLGVKSGINHLKKSGGLLPPVNYSAFVNLR